MSQRICSNLYLAIHSCPWRVFLGRRVSPESFHQKNTWNLGHFFRPFCQRFGFQSPRSAKKKLWFYLPRPTQAQKPGIILNHSQPLKPNPFSPVQRRRKLVQVLGTISSNNSNNSRPKGSPSAAISRKTLDMVGERELPAGGTVWLPLILSNLTHGLHY